MRADGSRLLLTGVILVLGLHRPLAMVVIGGLVSAMLLTLFALPALNTRLDERPSE